jgi:FkbH-like protein
MSSQNQDSDVLVAVENVVNKTSLAAVEEIEALAQAIERRGLLTSSHLKLLLEDRRSTNAIWLQARLLSATGEDARALDLWTAVLERLPVAASARPEMLLSRSRGHAQLQRFDAAFADLREAVTYCNHYGLLSRAAKALARLQRKVTPPGVRRIKLAVLSSTTTDLIAPLISLACFRDKIEVELYVAPYGNVQQEVRDSNSGLYRFQPDIVLVCLNWRDANLPDFSMSPDVEVDAALDQLTTLWRTLLSRHACQVIQHNFDLPAVDAFGHLGTITSGSRRKMLSEINRRLVEVAPSAVTILDQDQVAARHGKQLYFDRPLWYAAKQYPAAEALPLLVDQQMALIRAALGLTRKVLVLDLDNTLWGGVVGEDGVDGLQIGPPSATGEAHLALQTYAQALKQRGILLAVCSKNNKADAELPFQKRDEMVLHLSDFVAFEANWHDKPANIRAIARKLNLGTDSFVFVDDNPAERDLVRRELPEVAVPEMGQDPADYVSNLERGFYFEALRLSQEDLQRHDSYRSNALREDLLNATGSLDEYLQELQMEVDHGPFTEAVLSRVVQLIGKTNQFNLTTPRYTQEQVQRMMDSSDFLTRYFRLRDRYGDNGLIGLTILKRRDSQADAYEVDAWLMSCRVLGRRMEEFMLAAALHDLSTVGAKHLYARYVPTKKNELVADLLPRLGFREVDAANNAEYTIAVADNQNRWPPYFRSVETLLAT